MFRFKFVGNNFVSQLFVRISYNLTGKWKMEKLISSHL